MPQRKLISIGMDDASSSVNRKITEYNIIITEHGIKLKTIVKNHTYRNNRTRTYRNDKKNKILLKIFKTTDKRERVKIKSGRKTKIIVQKAKMKKIQREEEELITNAMQQLSVKRKSTQLNDEPEKRQRTQ